MLECVWNLPYESITITLLNNNEDILSWSFRFYGGGCECLYMAVGGFSSVIRNLSFREMPMGIRCDVTRRSCCAEKAECIFFLNGFSMKKHRESTYKLLNGLILNETNLNVQN